uniref:Uncharacterized protein n=1 Tax=Arundo donax TaxID=35708 RepID=A0A0A9BKI6_ARUDO
MVAARRRRLAS